MTSGENFEEVFAKHQVLGYLESGFGVDPICYSTRLGNVMILNERFCET